MSRCLTLTLLVLLTTIRPAYADVLVLVHGYLGSASSWAEAGAMARLQQRGFDHAGVLGFAPRGVSLRKNYAAQPPSKPMYTVELPSQAPITLQADWLAAQLREVNRLHPDEAIDIAAHSAGGLVARMMLVRHGKLSVRHLITIATPHFGTGRAIQALDATDDRGLIGGIKRWVVRRKTGPALYATVQQSRGVLLDLMPPAPGNLLFWLNRQPHPDIRYTAIMRIGTFAMPGDRVVPPPSQDLNRVPTLAGKVKTYSMAQGHLLTPRDGDLVGNLLAMPPE